MATSDKTTKPGWKAEKGTQRDLAPPPANPSEPPRPSSVPLTDPSDQTQVPVSRFASDAVTRPDLAFAAPPKERRSESTREELTPQEGTDPRQALEAAGRGDRSQFKTEPGGGKSRISGGRGAAAVYVNPVTLPPATGNTPVTSAIKVHQRVKEEVRNYVTEPSLLRRRASSLPPEPPGYRDDSRKMIFGLALALVAALGVIVWLSTSRPDPEDREQSASGDRPSASGDRPSSSGDRPSEVALSPSSPAPSPSEPVERSSPAAVEPPVPAMAPSSAVRTPSPPPSSADAQAKTGIAQELAPQAPPRASQGPRPAPAPQPAEKRNELWLE